MTTTFRPLQRCDRCRSKYRPRCDRLRADLSRLLVEAAVDAAKNGERLPDAELVLDCKSYCWRER